MSILAVNFHINCENYSNRSQLRQKYDDPKSQIYFFNLTLPSPEGFISPSSSTLNLTDDVTSDASKTSLERRHVSRTSLERRERGKWDVTKTSKAKSTQNLSGASIDDFKMGKF